VASVLLDSSVLWSLDPFFELNKKHADLMRLLKKNERKLNVQYPGENKLHFNRQFYHEHILMSSEMKQATITIACNILQNTAVVRKSVMFATGQDHLYHWVILLRSNFYDGNMYRHKNKGVLQMASL
jgi:hypothetical protein